MREYPTSAPYFWYHIVLHYPTMSWTDMFTGYSWPIEVGNLVLAVVVGVSVLRRPYETLEAVTLSAAFLFGFGLVFFGALKFAPWDVLWPTIRRYALGVVVSVAAMTAILMVVGPTSDPSAYAQSSPPFAVLLGIGGGSIWGALIVGAGGGLRSLIGLRRGPDLPDPDDFE